MNTKPIITIRIVRYEEIKNLDVSFSRDWTLAGISYLIINTEHTRPANIAFFFIFNTELAQIYDGKNGEKKREESSKMRY